MHRRVVPVSLAMRTKTIGGWQKKRKRKMIVVAPVAAKEGFNAKRRDFQQEKESDQAGDFFEEYCTPYTVL